MALALPRVTFQPYTRAQLVDIITRRLKDADALEAFDPNAITFAARKVASCSAALCMLLHAGMQPECMTPDCVHLPSQQCACLPECTARPFPAVQHFRPLLQVYVFCGQLPMPMSQGTCLGAVVQAHTYLLPDLRVLLQVASVSGDVRRALELCRKAAELLEASAADPASQPSPRKAPRAAASGASPRAHLASQKQVGFTRYGGSVAHVLAAWGSQGETGVASEGNASWQSPDEVAGLRVKQGAPNPQLGELAGFTNMTPDVRASPVDVHALCL